MAKPKKKSRQHLWILRQRLLGRCCSCARKAESKGNGKPGPLGRYIYCREHRLKCNERELLRRQGHWLGIESALKDTSAPY